MTSEPTDPSVQPGGQGQPGPPPPGVPQGAYQQPYPQPYQQPGYPQPAQGKMDGVSIAALVLGLAFFTGPIALVLGIVGIRRTGPGKLEGRGLAIAGLVLGALSVVGWILVLAIGLFAYNNARGEYSAATERFATQCNTGADDACDQLAYRDDLSTDQRARADTCGGRQPAGSLGQCVTLWFMGMGQELDSSTAPEATEPEPTTAPEPASGDTVPPASAAESRDWTGQITSSVGNLDVTLDGKKAPQAVASFVSLAQQGYFDNTSCHRLTTGANFKVLQCGDPTGTGTGGPGYSFGPIENAPTDQNYAKGTIAMARVGGDANSNGSQFFIVYGDTVIPDDTAGGYTVFGTVTGGLDAIEKVGQAGTTTGTEDGAPITPVTIEGVTLK